MLSEEKLKDVIQQYYGKLHEILPIEDDIFFAYLFQYGLLPGDNPGKIKELKTRANKVAHLMTDIVLPGVKKHLPNLLEVMKLCGDCAVKEFAEKIETTIGIGMIYSYGKCL